MAQHAVGELPAQLQQARPIRRHGQWRANPNGLPARQEDRREPVELGPERTLARGRGIDLSGDGRGNAEFARPAVFRDVQIPR